MKKILFMVIIFLSLGLASHVFAQGFVPLAPIPGLTQGVTADATGLANFFNNLYKYCIGLAAVLAIIEIIWGGLEISTQDSVSKKSDGKERITQAIFGLVLVLSPVLVFSIINPSILNLSLNLPKLDTVSGPPVQTETFVPPVTSGNLFAPNGDLIDCKNANNIVGVLNDCTAADQTCRQQAVGGASATPEVVCMINGKIDTRYKPGLGPTNVCPVGETKWIQCVVTTFNVPG
jgi:hypothetical protein